MQPLALPHRSERGITLIEMMIALVVLSLGVLAIAQLFPAGTRRQVSDRMLTTANNYAQQKLEDLSGVAWTDTTLTDGQHPTTDELLGSNGQWKRHYVVATMASPLDNLKKVTVTVSWKFQGSRTVTAITYLRR